MTIFDGYDDYSLEDDVKKVIEKFIKDNYDGSFKVSDKPNKDGKFEVSSNGDIKVRNKNITCLTNNLFIWDNVDGNFDCSCCKSLMSLVGAPKKVGGDFDCSCCKTLVSLAEAPKTVCGDFDCSCCKSLKFLAGAPKTVCGDFYCRDCGEKFTKCAVKEVSDVANVIYVDDIIYWTVGNCKSLLTGDMETRRALIHEQYKFINLAGLKDDLFENYCRLLSKVDSFYVSSIPGVPCFSEIRQTVPVIFSDQTPTYEEKNGKSGILLLGKHCLNHSKYGECVILYVNNIKACGSGPYHRLMTAVYIHELYHAYFRSGSKYLSEVEEPLAEFGALFCLEVMAAMRILDYKDVQYYGKQVDNKNNGQDPKDVLPEYAFGGYIYEKHLYKQGWSMGQLLESYRCKVHNPDITIPSISSMDHTTWEDAYKDLCKALL